MLDSQNPSSINYKSFRMIEDWKRFKEVIKKTKQEFFDNKILKIMSKNHRLWNLMSWVKNYKLPAIKALKFNRQPCIEINNLQQTLYQTFNSAQNC